MSVAPRDARGRPLGTLRLSVTDRCNLRCDYCMPEAEYAWLPREDLLSFEELEQIAGHFLAAGVRRLRVTGGEPLLRRELPALIRRLAGLNGLEDLALTTNGVLLAGQAHDLRAAGLHRITVSLDSLDRRRYLRLARRDELARTLEGVQAARRCGLPLKLDTVVLRGENDDELGDLLGYAREVGAEIRFIEYMDVGGATRWNASAVVSRTEILTRIAAASGGAPVPADAGNPSAPARLYRTQQGQIFGVIASTTEPFCGTCDRSRLTADGRWLTCLYAADGEDLRAPLRAGRDRAWFLRRIRTHWRVRQDRGAEERLALRERRGPLLDLDELLREPHREMHVRGG